MLIALLLALGLAWWMHQRGELLPNLQRVLIGGGLALLALRMLETGRIGFAVLAGAAAAGWWVMHPNVAGKIGTSGFSGSTLVSHGSCSLTHCPVFARR